MHRLLDRLAWRRDEVVAIPSQARPGVAARAYAYLLGLGGLLAGLLPLAPGSQVVEPLLLGATVGLAFGTAGALLVTYAATPPLALRVLPSLGMLLVGAAMLAVTPTARPAWALLLFWAVLAACFFYGFAVADVALAVVVLGAGLALGDGPDWWATWVAGAVTLTVFGVMLALLRRRTDTLIVALDEAARTDPLTGLLNRRGIAAALETELERARRSERCCSVLLLDVDAFKALNDAHGHAAGDAALRRIGRALDARRPSDSAARVGGDEFLVVLGETDLDGALHRAERVVEELAPLHVSVGVASFPAHAGDPDALCEAADRALYAAKAAGGGRVAMFAPQDHTDPGPRTP